MRKVRAGILAAAMTLCCGIPAMAQARGGAAESARVVNTFKLGGEGRWDYVAVDPATHLVYVTRQSHVQVVDEASGKLVADIPNTPGVHGVALAHDLGRGFTSNGQGNSVTVFDLKTHKALFTIPAGKNPDAILYDPASKKVLAFNGRSNDVTVIDANAEAGKGAGESATIKLDGKPEFAATDEQGHVFVNIEDKSTIVAIDTKTMKISDTWKIEGGEEPSGLAIDAAHHRLFAGCGNQVMAIVDSQSGKTLGTVPIGKGVDACGFDPQTGEAFASCGDGTLTIIRETGGGKFQAVQTLKTRPGARTMGLDPRTHMIFLPTAEFPDAPAQGDRRPAPKPDSFMLVVVEEGSAGK